MYEPNRVQNACLLRTNSTLSDSQDSQRKSLLLNKAQQKMKRKITNQEDYKPRLQTNFLEIIEDNCLLRRRVGKEFIYNLLDEVAAIVMAMTSSITMETTNKVRAHMGMTSSITAICKIQCKYTVIMQSLVSLDITFFNCLYQS